VKVVLPGGSGQVGTVLGRAPERDGHEVVVLGRGGGRPGGPGRGVTWDARTLGPWAQEIDGADVVVNLAGHTVNCRYTPANRRAITQSRVDSTRVVGEAIARADAPPRTWLQMSTATIYAHRYDAPNDEETGILGGGEPDLPDTWRFSLDVVDAWEKTLAEAPTPQTRKVALRAAMIMDPDPGGVFDTLLGLVRRGLGGRVADGRQYVSWIHHEDFTRMVSWLAEREDVEGAVNAAAPHPLPYAEFMRALREAWGARVGLPATRWMLEVAAVLMRTESELALKSRRVVPGRALAGGFAFRHPGWPEAARALVTEWRAARAARR